MGHGITHVSVCFVLVLAAKALGYEEEEAAPYNLYGGSYAPQYKNYEPRDYHFDYAVSDPHTGDHKSQWEVKEKGVVKGAYSLVEPDGTTRVVEYIADDHGFRAVVKKLGTPIHSEPAPIPHYAPIKETYQPQLPIYEEYKGAYDGQYQNYVPELKPEYIYAPYAPASPVKVEQQYYQQPAPIAYYAQPVEAVKAAPVVSAYYPKPVEVAPVAPAYYSKPVEAAPVAPAYYPKPAEAAPVVPYEQKQEEPEERVEYHGFTGNSDDDSEYTKYDDGEGEGEKEEYNEGNYEYEESKPAAQTVPYNLVQGYQKQPLVYLIKQYPGY